MLSFRTPCTRHWKKKKENITGLSIVLYTFYIFYRCKKVSIRLCMLLILFHNKSQFLRVIADTRQLSSEQLPSLLHCVNFLLLYWRFLHFIEYFISYESLYIYVSTEGSLLFSSTDVNLSCSKLSDKSFCKK